MADIRKRVAESVEGELFVDTTCIDCDTCRQLAPATFADQGDYSYVARQPATPAEERRALHALLACPTGSIGTLGANRAREAMGDFPLAVGGPEGTEGGTGADDVLYCGFTARDSFGASSYLLLREDGNWLVDSPRYTPALARALEARGGVARIFLTHSDDVADAARWAERFGARRTIHRAELDAQPDAEDVVDGETELAPGVRCIPTPGHTRGHCVLAVDDRLLFSGDHLWWSRVRGHLVASRSACWYSWSEQTRSMERLLAQPFTWVLPGHGGRRRLEPEEREHELRALVARMRRAA